MPNTIFTVAGTQTGGWMQRLKDQGLNPATPESSASATNTTPTDLVPSLSTITMTRADINRKITAEELASHATPENGWFVIQGEVRIALCEVDC